MSRNGMRLGVRRSREGAGVRPGARLAGLRWVPLPLAVLTAVAGLLIVGALQGQQAAAHDQALGNGFQAGGLALSVDQMMWMSNDMTGQGPLKVPKGFPMDPTMMAGMQPVGDNRLRVEVDLSNTTSQQQRYALSDFRVLAPGGQSWKNSDDGGNQPGSSTGVLEPGFKATLDIYFDIPTQQSKNLSVKWSHGSSTVEFPVNTSGVLPSPHRH